MILFKKATDIRHWLALQQEKGAPVGFVPTMGALHPGHISLLDTAIKRDPITVCSIFVNPTQFNDPADFEKYPVTLERDLEMLEATGCHAVFLPSVKEIYPEGLKPTRIYELGDIETILEGKYRPGHFQGVCRVVHRLLDIVQPDRLYLGQKDYQQCMVIHKLVSLLSLPTEIILCPTLREKDGLAMSSRNMRLSEEQRKTAANIYAVLLRLKQDLREGPVAPWKEEALNSLRQAGFRPDYVELADAQNLSAIEHWDGRQKMVALVAAYLGEVRLIDNLVVH